MRMWLVSSTWFQLFSDLLIFVSSSLVFAAISSTFQSWDQYLRFVPNAPLPFHPQRFMFWYVLRYMVYLPPWPPEDCLTPRERLEDTGWVALASSFIEPLMVFVASRLSWTAIGVAVLLGTVDYFAVHEMVWIVYHPHPDKNIQTGLLAFFVALLAFGKKVLEVAPNLVEFYLLWFPFIMIIGRLLNSKQFLDLYAVSFQFFRSFVLVPLGCSLFCVLISISWNDSKRKTLPA